MPCDWSRYPKNWKTEIRPRILAREENRCKWCHAENGASLPKPCCDEASYNERGKCHSCGRRRPRVVLTVAHLDHDTTNNTDDNLAALCQRCHLTYDARHHAGNARRTRERRKASTTTTTTTTTPPHTTTMKKKSEAPAKKKQGAKAPTPSPTSTTTSSEQITIQELAPVRAWARGNTGSIQRLAEEVQRITGEDANRHMIGRWIREEKPVQPRFGYGIALLRAYENLAKPDDAA